MWRCSSSGNCVRIFYFWNFFLRNWFCILFECLPSGKLLSCNSFLSTALGKVTHMWGAHEQVFLQHQRHIWYENICIQESLLCRCIRARILWPTFRYLEGFNVIFWVFNWILKFEHELSFIIWPWISVGRIKAQQELMYRVCWDGILSNPSQMWSS